METMDLCGTRKEYRTLEKERTQSKVIPVFKKWYETMNKGHKKSESEILAWRNGKEEKDFTALHNPQLTFTLGYIILNWFMTMW